MACARPAAVQRAVRVLAPGLRDAPCAAVRHYSQVLLLVLYGIEARPNSKCAAVRARRAREAWRVRDNQRGGDRKFQFAAGRGQQEEEAKHVRGRIEWPAPAPGEGVSVDCYWKEGLARKSGVGADRVLCLVSAPPLMRNQATRQGTNLEINNKGDRSRVFPDSQTRYSRLLMINIKTTSRRYYVAPPHARARAWGRARPVGACCPLTPWYAPACGCCGVSGGLLRRRSLNWAWCCAYRRLIAPAGRRGLVV